MALEQMGLGAIVVLDPAQLEAGAKRGQRAFQGLQRSASRSATKMENRMAKAFRRIGRGAKSVASGFNQMAMAALPAAAAFGFGALQAVKYEKQLSSIKAVMRGISNTEYKMLTDKTRQLGIESVFSATQSAEAMEELARLGFKTNDIMAAIGPTLDSAAVAGIGLAEAAQQVAGVTRAMGLETAEAGRVSDVLTAASQNSGTTLSEMAEAMAFGASSATQWGMSLEETGAVLGKMADRMHKGSTGGMLLMNLITKLQAPTRQARKYIKELGVEMIKADGSGFRPLIDVVMDFQESLERIPSLAKRAEVTAVIFPQRAKRAFHDLVQAGRKDTKELQNTLVNSMGAAAEAAATKLDNLHGAFILFKSSVESLAITTFEGFMVGGKEAFQGITEDLNVFLEAVGEIRKPMRKGGDAMDRYREVAMKFGKDAADAALGFERGLQNIKMTLLDVKDGLLGVASAVGWAFGAESKAQVVEWTTTATGIAAILVPLGLAIKPLQWAFQGLWSVIAGGFGILVGFAGIIKGILAAGILKSLSLGLFAVQLYAAVAWKMIGGLAAMVGLAALPFAILALGVAALGVALVALKRDGQSWGDYFKELLGNIGKWWGDVFSGMVRKTHWFALQVMGALNNLGLGDWSNEIAEMNRQLTKPVGRKKPKITTPQEREKAFGAQMTEGDKRYWEKRLDKERGEPTLEQKDLTGFQYSREVEKDKDKWMKDLAGSLNRNADGTMKAAKAAEFAAMSAEEAAKSDKCTEIKIDGREVAKANSKAERNIQQRGGKEKNWQPGIVAVHGAMPVMR